MTTPAICIALMGSLPTGSTWTYGSGRLAVRPFNDADDAALFKLKYSTKATPVWIHTDEHGHLAYALSSARQYWAEVAHRRDANVSVSREKLKRILLLLDTKKWTSEAEITAAVPLTRFEWASLERHHYVRRARRKQGLAFRLSKDGERERVRVLAEQRRKGERLKRPEEHERLLSEACDTIVRIEKLRARLESPLSVIHLPDESGLKFGLPAVILTNGVD